MVAVPRPRSAAVPRRYDEAIEEDAPPSSAEQSVRIGGRRVILRRAADRLPTKWLGAAIAVLFLISTAAFGSLRAAPGESIAEIAIGETYANDQVSVEVERLIVTDSLDGWPPPAGQRIVVLVMTITNRWNRPLSSRDYLTSVLSVSTPPDDVTGRGAIGETLLGPDDVPMRTRTADATAIETLQPGVPVHQAWTWTVDNATAQQFVGGGEVVVTIFDQLLTVGTYASAVSSWGQPTPGAELVVRPETRPSVNVTELQPVERLVPTTTAPEEGG